MFSNLGTQDSSRYFTNLMSGHDGQTLSMQNSGNYQLDATNGVQLALGNKLSVTNIKVTAQRAVSVQFWFKGSFVDQAQLSGLFKSSTLKLGYFERDGANVVAKSSYSSKTVTLTNLATQASSTSWTFVGLSVGWITSSNNFVM